MWDAISDTYSEAVKGFLPLHRIAAAILVFVGCGVAPQAAYKSVFESLARTSLQSLEWGKDGIFADFVIGHVLASVAFVTASWLLSRLIAAATFGFVSKALSLKPKFQAALKARQSQDSDDVETTKTSKEYLESLLEAPKRKIKSWNSRAEFSCAVFLSFGVAWHWGNCIDALISLGGLASAWYASTRAMKVFLSEYIGSALHIAALTGRPLPALGDVD